MTRRDRGLAMLIVVVIHLAAFVPTIGDDSSILDLGFWPKSELILHGAKPYADADFEYPPLALPLVVGPAAVTTGLTGYRQVFEAEMLGFDLAIVAVLALALPGRPRRIWEALGVYSAGVIAVSGVVLPQSSIETAPLSLARFDLAMALLVLGGVLAREAKRSALWSALIGTATALKAIPLLLFPNLAQGERLPRRAVIAGLVPIVVAAAIVLGFGDEFGSAISYHTGRALQIESLGATPILVSHLMFGTAAAATTGSGGFNITAPAASLARSLSISAVLIGAGALIWFGRQRRTPPALIAVPILAVVVAFAPVLSPQFLLWLLPLSAATYGLGRENVVLLACFVLTEIVLHFYYGVDALSGNFVWPLAARNVLLVVYLGLVARAAFAPASAPTSSGNALRG